MRAFKLIDMNVIKYPTTEELPSLLKRPVRDAADLNQIVAAVLANVKAHGDHAVFDYEEQFDHVKLDNLVVSEAEIEEAWENLQPDLKASLELAHHNIEKFHRAQQFDGVCVEVTPGVKCWQKAVAIERVGLYIPGGTAPVPP